MSILNIKIRIVQNVHGEDVITGKWPNFGGIDEKTFHAYEEEAARVLSENPALIPLFQNGALLEVGVKGPNPQVDIVTNYMGIQIVGAQNKSPKNKLQDFGRIGISRLRTKDVPFCFFDVRLVSL